MAGVRECLKAMAAGPVRAVGWMTAKLAGTTARNGQGTGLATLRTTADSFSKHLSVSIQASDGASAGLARVSTGKGYAGLPDAADRAASCRR